MSSYTNVGVEAPNNRTKKAFREAVKADPSTVRLYGTSLFKPLDPTPVDRLPDGMYTVVGPWPERERKWYATVKIIGGVARVS